MNHDRIRSTLDVLRLRECHVVLVGGAVGLAGDLTRCGVGRITHVDFDIITETNPARQDFFPGDLWRKKIDATADHLRRINPNVEVHTINGDLCTLSDHEIKQHLGDADLLIFGTDAHQAQARGNQIALQLKIPALWIGLYRGGRAGEIIHYVPQITPACYRCICSSRYEGFQKAAQVAYRDNGHTDPTQISPPVTSDGGTILDLHLVDAIAGHIALGILMRGTESRYGHMIEALEDRNLLQVKIDPNYRLGDRDIFGEYLGNHPANFSFTTIALPMEPEADCPDCGGGDRHHEVAMDVDATDAQAHETDDAGTPREAA